MSMFTIIATKTAIEKAVDISLLFACIFFNIFLFILPATKGADGASVSEVIALNKLVIFFDRSSTRLCDLDWIFSFSDGD